MTPARAQRIREMCEQATPGPWHCEDDGERTYVSMGRGLPPLHEMPKHDAAFIAESRYLIPDLLAECERLRALVAEACDLAAIDRKTEAEWNRVREIRRELKE